MITYWVTLMSCSFQTKTHGKWILAGEHTVLRGGSAIVFPLQAKTLTLSYLANNEPLSASFHGLFGDDIKLLFFSVIEEGLQLCDKHLSHATGHFDIENHVPIGAGLGASAALCFALSRWFTYQGLCSEDNELHFAKSLEDLFHKKSSGLDLVGCSSISPMLFSPTAIESLQPTWQPKLYLSYSGHLGMTSHCVTKVNSLFDEAKEKALAIDEKMQCSVDNAYSALTQEPRDGLTLLKQAIDDAYQCFCDWSLADEALVSHINWLKQQGAIAAKPTGSGSGGYVLSLWQEEPEEALRETFIEAV